MAIKYGLSIFSSIEDDTIDFNAPPMMIDDLNDSTALLEFRFRKDDLSKLALLLKPKIFHFIDHDDDNYIFVQNRRSPQWIVVVIGCKTSIQ